MWLAAACLATLAGTQTVAQPLVTGDLTIYYDFDSFTDIVMDGSGNDFNGKVQDGTRNVLDGVTGHADLVTTGVITNDHSNPRRGAGAIRFTQSVFTTEDPVFVDMDGGVIKANHPEKLPLAAATYAAWVNLAPVNFANGWNSAAASIVQGSSAGGGHGTPHFQAEGNGSLRIAFREEFGLNVASSNSPPYSAHPFPNQPDIDSSGAAPQLWPANTWFHYAATYDKNANGGADEFAMYFNGVKIRGGVANGPSAGMDLGAWDLRAFTDYYDGLGLGAVYDSGGRRLHGMVDELYIFHRALSAAEIGKLVSFPVPEPATFGMLLAGLGMLATRCRRRSG
jgi:hypothetical protein